MSRFKQWNTLRNQLLAVFLLAMMIVLFIVGGIIFKQVSDTLTDNAERQIEQTTLLYDSEAGWFDVCW